MVGLHKFTDKEKRAQRRRNHIARDLLTPKYHPRVVPDKRRVDNEDGTFYLIERYYDDDE
jgi:hypothetical protein